jgi:hypothetical protein
VDSFGEPRCEWEVDGQPCRKPGRPFQEPQPNSGVIVMREKIYCDEHREAAIKRLFKSRS